MRRQRHTEGHGELGAGDRKFSRWSLRHLGDRQTQAGEAGRSEGSPAEASELIVRVPGSPRGLKQGMAGPGSPRKDALKQERPGVEGSLGVFYNHPGL